MNKSPFNDATHQLLLKREFSSKQYRFPDIFRVCCDFSGRLSSRKFILKIYFEKIIERANSL